MVYIIYLTIFISVAGIFWITLQITQKMDDRQLTIRAIKGYHPVVLVDSRILSEEIMNTNTKKVIEKLQKLDEEGSSNKSFIQKTSYKINYVFDVNPYRQFVMMGLMTIGIIMGLILFLGAPILIAIIVAPIFGGLLTLFRLNLMFNKKIATFLDNFVYAMDVIVRGIRTGLPINDCFRLIVKDSEPVVAEQFMAMIDDYKLGMPTSQVMQRFMKRMPLKEVRFFGLSIIIQSQTGGNLAEVISNLGNILRNRKTMLIKIKTLSSEAKTSAIIMGCLPIMIIGILSLVAPDYMSLLTTTTKGNLVLVGCGMWMMIGGFIMHNMINFYK